jgi:glutathione synthase
VTQHILFIDPIEKLVVKKDSSLLLALTLQAAGHKVYLLFEEDFYVSNEVKFQGGMSYGIYSFTGNISSDDFSIKNFQLTTKQEIPLKAGDIFHMRLDPPFDGRYLRYLWMLQYLQHQKINVLNSPNGILHNNEKMVAFANHEMSAQTYIGQSVSGFLDFCKELTASGVQEMILKPLDAYQGMGVEKISLAGVAQDKLSEVFAKKVKELSGSVLAQPFLSEVRQGEVRACYFNGLEMGTILKVPKEGHFLANIAQGASYASHELNSIQRKACLNISQQLAKEGVLWTAFDIIGDRISEVNVTCPGLVVEISKALKTNIAKRIVSELEKSYNH